MRVIVSGASGFLGSHVTKELLARGMEVAVILRGDAAPARLADVMGQVQVVRADLSQPEGLAAALAPLRPDALVHMAWMGVAGVARNDTAQVDNIAASLSLFEAAAAAGVKHIVNAGSQAEYGVLNQRIREGDPTHPTTLYGEAKLALCNRAKVFCAQEGIRFAHLRVFSTYGPHDHPHWLVGYVITRLLAGEKPALTPCEQLWDFLYAGDAANAFADVLETPDAEGVFNLGSGQAQPLRETVEYIRDLINPALPLGFGEIPYRPDQVMRLEADIALLQNSTRWRPRVTLQNGLQQTVAWYAAGG